MGAGSDDGEGEDDVNTAYDAAQRARDKAGAWSLGRHVLQEPPLPRQPDNTATPAPAVGGSKYAPFRHLGYVMCEDGWLLEKKVGGQRVSRRLQRDWFDMVRCCHTHM
jgi:hypothetical protein